jgi:phosphoserine phosphatase
MSLPPEPPANTLLVSLTGRDRPGLTAQLFTALSAHDVEVLDVEQVTVRGRLVLAVLLNPAASFDEVAFRRALVLLGDQLGVEVELAPGHGDHRRPPGRAHITVLGFPLRPGAVAALTDTVAKAGANIDRIVRLASYPVTSIEFEVSGADPAELKTSIAAVALAEGADVAVQPSGLLRRSKRLVVMDVDSTLVQGEVIEMLAARAGVLDQVATVTARAMQGELDFAASLRERVRLLAGLPASAVAEVRAEVQLTPGARTLVRTLKRLDYKCAIVSGGFSQITDPLADELGIDYSAANTLEIADGVLTGGLVGPVLDRAGKAAALARFAAAEGIPLSQTIAVGDGANDLDMIRLSGTGVALHAKPSVAAEAKIRIDHGDLTALLYLQGYRREDFVE